MMNERPRLPGELGFAAFLLIVSLLIFYFAYQISGFSGISTAGIFPMLAAATMVVSSASILARTMKTLPEHQGSDLLRQFGQRITPPVVAVYALIIVGFMAALEPLGFVISTFAFLLLSFVFLYRKGFILSLVISAVSVAVILVIFRYVFQVVLPEGMFSL